MTIPTQMADAAAAASGGEDVTAAACLFRGLGDPTRLMIVRHLARGEHRVVDLVAHLGLAQSTVSGHLACLRDCGLVTARAVGRASVYRLARPELVDLLAAAEAFLQAGGDGVTLCPTYGTAAPRAGAPRAGAPRAGAAGQAPVAPGTVGQPV